MTDAKNQSGMAYHVTVTHRDAAHAVAETRGHTLLLNVKKGDGAAGFNAAETLLAALGTCILTNVNSISQKMNLQIDDARLEFDALRRDDPAALVQIRYRLILRSSEPEDRLRHLHELSIKWGTVTNTIINGLTPAGELVIEPFAKGEQ
ncbi:MAG TPA: OsmC family peroxiredoxin [Anaerolineae bacterium]|nr:OsmC family peroxiredoxin [Anaerolineae bacterium]